MTTTVQTPGQTATTRVPRLTFGGILTSEWIKLRTVRSTFWCYLIIVVLPVLLGLLFAGAVKASATPLSHDAQQSSWMSAALLGVNFSELVIGVLGALVITGEYGTGMIRSTFTAVPRRLAAILGKAIVFAVVTFVVSFLGLVASALVTAPILSGKGVTADFGDPDVWFTLVGGAGYLTLIGLISLAIGLIIRNSAGGIAASLGLVLVVPVVFRLLANLAQAEWAKNVGAFLPSDAGAKIWAYPVAQTAVTDGSVDLTSWQGLLVLIGWVVVGFVVGGLLVTRRDV